MEMEGERRRERMERGRGGGKGELERETRPIKGVQCISKRELKRKCIMRGYLLCP